MSEQDTLSEQADPQDSAAIELIMAENITARVLRSLAVAYGAHVPPDGSTATPDVIAERLVVTALRPSSHSSYTELASVLAEVMRYNNQIRDVIIDVVRQEMINSTTHTRVVGYTDNTGNTNGSTY